MSANSSSYPQFCGVLPQAPPRVAVLIAAYEPARSLEHLIEQLTEAGVPAILVVDDGSRPERRRAFARIALNPAVHVLRHTRSEGKGMALKTGMRYFVEHLGHYTGLVTADADGQHSADDVLRVARALYKAPRLAILGARSFCRLSAESRRAVPQRVLIGNRLMIFLFRAFTGLPLSDAQTGLRGLPTALLPRLLELPGSRYEYEMQVLLHIARSGHPLAEQPIRILPDAGNMDLHFRLLSDTWRLIRTLLAAPQPSSGKPEVSAPAAPPALPARVGSAWTLHTK
jgi:glycosyltransferase involved in cell wall biosynthesis